MIDLSSLTLGEVAKIEELAGMSIAAISDDDKPKGNALAAIAMVVKRRSGEPAFTWNQAQALTFDEVSELLGMNDDEADDDPKDD